MPPEKATAHRRARLLGAMVEAVRRHGYPDTTIAELVGLAGVSKSAFYESFESKRQCFLAAFDEILALASERVGVAYRSRTDFQERLRAGMEAFAEVVAEEPAASALVVVDSLSLGAAGAEPRERALEAFALMFRQSFAQVPERGEVSEHQVRAIVAGIRRVVYRCLREDRPEEIRDHVDELLGWALAYQRPGGATTARTGVARSFPRSQRAAREAPGSHLLSWEEPPDSPRIRTELTQRERIIRAVALIVADRGYDALTIPAISGAAGVSNATFYEHFPGKEDAFIVAFDVLAEEALRATAVAAASVEGSWTEMVEAAIGGMLEFIAANRLFARLAFFELPTAGASALDRADATTRHFTAFLAPGTLPGGIAPPPKVVTEAIGGGVWAVIEHEIAHGRRESLAEMTPQIVDLVLAPFEAQ